MADSVDRMDFTDSVVCHFARAVVSITDGSAVETSENKLIVDFKNREIRLPTTSSESVPFSSQCLPSSLDDSLIRYAAFILPPDYDTRSKEMHVVVLSTWQKENKDIHNSYFVMNQSEASLLLDAVSRLISRQSRTKALEFYPLVTGRAMVSNCDLVRHSEEKTDCCSPQKLMSFILDPESLSIFEHGLSNKPTYDFRFYKEQGPRVIDIISVSRDFSHIILQQQNQVCIIRKNCDPKTDEEAYEKLLQMFMKNVTKPQPEEYFINPEHNMSVAAPQPDRGTPDEKQMESGWQESEGQKINVQEPIKQWLRDLYSGDHIRRHIDEGVQLMWVTFEHDLRGCLESGTLPESEIKSAGVDPFSQSHLQHSIEDIRDQLLNNDMVLALSRLQACLSVYKGTLLLPVSTLDQVELLKRIYFLSSRY